MMFTKVVQTINGLKSEDGKNPEYDRALVEMGCDILGIPMELGKPMLGAACSIVPRMKVYRFLYPSGSGGFRTWNIEFRTWSIEAISMDEAVKLFHIEIPNTSLIVEPS